MGRSDTGAGSFDDLLSIGARYCVVLEVQGLVQLFPEFDPQRHDSEAVMTLPAAYESVCPALMFDESAAFTIELDRDTGFARGDGVDFILAWEQLEASDLLTALFKVPSLRSRLTAAFEHASTSAEVDSTAGWTEDQRAYIGHETMTVAITDGDTFSVMARDASPLYNYRAASPSSFGSITDVPEIWTQRFVTVHVHLLSPEGRALDSTWLTGDFHRIVWRGFIEKPPKESEFGMRLRALPLCRLPAKLVGYELGVEVVVPDPEDAWSFADHPIVVTRESNITVHGEYTGGGSFSVTVPAVDGDAYPSTIAEWARTTQAALDTALSGQAWYATGTYVDVSGLATGPHTSAANAYLPGSLIIKIPYNAGGGFNVTTLSLIVHPGPGTYWLQPGHREGFKGLNNEPNWSFWQGWPAVVLDYQVGSWLPVVQTSGEGYADLTVPNEGVAMVEVDGAKELIRWENDDAMAGPAGQDDVRLLRITERGVAGTAIVDLGAGAELKFVSGHDGTPAEILLTLLQSSGTGTRGAYDTLAIGMGYGIPSDYIDEASFARIELNEEQVAAYNDGRATLEELMGGWLALQGLCLTQRRFADGGYRLTIVRTEPALPASTDDLVVTLLATDVEMGGVGQPDTIEAATEVRVARSGIARDLPDVVPQDVPAIQAMGLVAKDFSAPGMSETVARDAANSRIARGLGQSVVQMRTMPWLSVQTGDIVRDQTAHPGSYDWSTGTRAPAEVASRVAGERWEPVGGRVTTTMLRAGLVPAGLYLCPVTAVTAVASTTAFSTAPGDNTRFAPSGNIRAIVYNPGMESVESALLELVPDGDGDWTLATGTLAGWVVAGQTLMTFGDLGTNDPLIEPAHIFVAATRRWGT